jgi:hypothetical protein
MDGLVEVMSDIFISELENVVDALETLDAAGRVGAAGAAGADGIDAVSEDWPSDPSALKGEGLRVRRRRW